MAKHGVTFARVAMGIVFFWFGILWSGIGDLQDPRRQMVYPAAFSEIYSAPARLDRRKALLRQAG
jgi:hypothetical protein